MGALSHAPWRVCYRVSEVTSVELPTLVIVAGASASAIEALFGKRGFVTYVAGGAERLAQLVKDAGLAPSAAILDFELPDADQSLSLLTRDARKPVLIGIASSDGLLIGENLLDSAFTRPVDPARLFARVVQLLAGRKKGRRQGSKRLTGVVAVVRGNRLFHLIERELTLVVTKVNAGAILENALRQVGADPTNVTKANARVMLEGGSLAQALEDFGEPGAIVESLGRLQKLLEAWPE
jgi:DNA-binding response OmpR family regulator